MDYLPSVVECDIESEVCVWGGGGGVETKILRGGKHVEALAGKIACPVAPAKRSK